ncbi:PHP domain-containing protein [Wenjunlia tyrosinilytica]|uniref:Histidinol-phosphatase n=1 Tax=Wenjunlia tyrosinilytica TaxID=1544741 RepID=A0A918DZA3_9ACTN|nr:PHP domain-containing protein [Wenjunlia tyrosinilytica]GGO90821.1 histidinol-phosphatase [Wenjunlia tyrosinilytica]
MPNDRRPVPEWADPRVPEEDLDRQGVSRRGMLRRAGLFGAGFAGASLLSASPAAAGPAAPAAAPAAAGGHGDDPDLVYLVGDHHVHSVYSHDAKYTFSQLAMRAAQFGLDWMVFTEHSNFGHANAGGALKEHDEVLKARAENPRMLVFQGLEWYIPAAEHATVFSPPGPHEADLLRSFELSYDGKLLGRTQGAPDHADTPGNEQLAVDGIKWLADRRSEGYVDDVLVLANHPSRLGINSPHEIRAWRDAAPEIVIGMEGAPGSQGAALPGLRGATSIRGEYENKPSAQSWPGYPDQAYVTYGGFDWMTATVGGMWDALLCEGRLFSVTSNSDNHRTVLDTWRNGDWGPGENFDNTGKLPDPVNTSQPQPGSDFWPGQFSRTHVGVTRYGYREVMAGLRAGRVWVDHGQLVDGIDVRLSSGYGDRRGATLGGRLQVRRGERLTLTVTVTTASRPNFHGVLPRLAHVDVIRGAVRGPAKDRDSWRAPGTKVVHTSDVSDRTGTYTLRIPVGRAEESFYLRLRGSDGRRNGPGPLGASVDPHGPVPHKPGDGDPWLDTWLYTNPIFVDVRH